MEPRVVSRTDGVLCWPFLLLCLLDFLFCRRGDWQHHPAAAMVYLSLFHNPLFQSRSAEISPRGRPVTGQSALGGILDSRAILQCKYENPGQTSLKEIFIVPAEYCREEYASNIPHNAYPVFLLPSLRRQIKVEREKRQDPRVPSREATSPKREVQGIISSIYRAFLPSFFSFFSFSFSFFSLTSLPFTHCRLSASFINPLCCLVLLIARQRDRVIALFFICLAI